jgi:UDP:flavonoid glycosyltransferase YjiC (YdhE family)
MAEILCVTSGLSGVLFSTLELGRRLRAAGHQVAHASFPHAQPEVAAQGFQFVELPADRSREFLAGDAERSWAARWRTLATRRAEAARSLELASFQADLETRRPDLILLDGEMHEQIVVALAHSRRHRVPLALLNSFVSIWRRPGLPPPHHLVRPGEGWRGSAFGVEFLWMQLHLRKKLRRWLQWMRLAGCDRQSLLSRLARQHGLSLAEETDASQWLMPLTWRRLPVLTLHAVEFEFPHPVRAGVHYVGPMVLQQRRDRVDTGEQRQQSTRLERLYTARAASSGQRRLIYAGFGSFLSADIDLLRQLCAAAAAHRDWDLVLSLGGRTLDPATRAALGPVADNVHLVPWAPQVEVLRHADVAVVHGGTNTADECVLAGVPMLVYCGHQTDMAGTTARIAFHGLGVGGRRGDSAKQISAHVTRLLSEPGFAERLGRFQLAYRRYQVERVAERTVDDLLATPQVAP